MTLDLLDILLVSAFVFDKHVPWWLWIGGVVASFAGSYRLDQIIKALNK